MHAFSYFLIFDCMEFRVGHPLHSSLPIRLFIFKHKLNSRGEWPRWVSHNASRASAKSSWATRFTTYFSFLFLYYSLASLSSNAVQLFTEKPSSRFFISLQVWLEQQSVSCRSGTMYVSKGASLQKLAWFTARTACSSVRPSLTLSFPSLFLIN